MILLPNTRVNSSNFENFKLTYRALIQQIEEIRQESITYIGVIEDVLLYI